MSSVLDAFDDGGSTDTVSTHTGAESAGEDAIKLSIDRVSKLPSTPKRRVLLRGLHALDGIFDTIEILCITISESHAALLREHSARNESSRQHSEITFKMCMDLLYDSLS
jgi:hypothetical protein